MLPKQINNEKQKIKFQDTKILKKERSYYYPSQLMKKENFIPLYQKIDKNDKTLIFESRFECGNLEYAIKVNDNEYLLVLQNDTNTNGHTQCFVNRVFLLSVKYYSRIKSKIYFCKFSK